MKPHKIKFVPAACGAKSSILSRTAIGALMFLALAAAPVRATIYTSVVDQEFVAPAGRFSAAVYYKQYWGQTFTVGLADQLTQVDLQLGRDDGVVQPLQMEIRKLIGGLPDLSAQGLQYSTQIAPSAVPIVMFPTTFTSVDLGAGAFAVAPGDQLAILLSTDERRWYRWENEDAVDGYAAGTALAGSPSLPNYIPFNTDAGFRTWVAVPEPTTLLPVGLVLLARLRRASAKRSR